MPGTLLTACIEQYDRLRADEELSALTVAQLGNGWGKERDVAEGIAALRARRAGQPDPRRAPATHKELAAFMRSAGAAMRTVA